MNAHADVRRDSFLFNFRAANGRFALTAPVVDALIHSRGRAVYALALPMYLVGNHPHPDYLDQLQSQRFPSHDQLGTHRVGTFLSNLPRYRHDLDEPPAENGEQSVVRVTNR